MNNPYAPQQNFNFDIRWVCYVLMIGILVILLTRCNTPKLTIYGIKDEHTKAVLWGIDGDSAFWKNTLLGTNIKLKYIDSSNFKKPKIYFVTIFSYPYSLELLLQNERDRILDQKSINFTRRKEDIWK